jgi:hypothetical protein
MAMANSYSVSIRLQRVTVESALRCRLRMGQRELPQRLKPISVVGFSARAKSRSLTSLARGASGFGMTAGWARVQGLGSAESAEPSWAKFFAVPFGTQSPRSETLSG